MYRPVCLVLWKNTLSIFLSKLREAGENYMLTNFKIYTSKKHYEVIKPGMIRWANHVICIEIS